MGRAVKLRPYQEQAIAAVRARWDAGDRSTLLVLPTGTGKTVVFAELTRGAAEAGGRALVLAHREELLDQARAKLEAVGVWAEIEQAQRRAVLSARTQAVVASVQTLRGKRLEAFARDAFTHIVVDEAHHAAAKGYRAIIDHFDSAQVLGVTATPDRGDGVGLGEVFQSCAFQYEIRQAIAEGYLAPIVARRVVVEAVDLSAVKTRAGDLAQNELAAVMADEEALHGVAIPLAELAGDRPTLAFAVDVAHAHKLAEVLNRYRPGWARALDGTCEREHRVATLADFRAGAFGCLVNVGLFTEGTDIPAVSCVALARPTKSRALYVQMAGRGLRLSPETSKRDCLLLDFTGTAGRHRLVGPVDVLAGGELSDDVRAEAERRLAGEQLELDDVLEAAAAEVERVRTERKLTATAKYVAEQLDPFVGDEALDLELAELRGRPGEPATQAQRERLDRKGLTNLPAELTRGEAAAILRKLDERQQLGLATLKQVRLLVRLGVDRNEASMTPFAAASRRIDELLAAQRSQRARRAQPGGFW